ncbi:DUF7109 family protein [Haloplanus sp. XH21]|uniref:DUF7109 family protein n=1 Tax=Haloplanus halobius TaxID=2934938 RepID=UPI0024B19AC1|nr:hypothetical protein [Haloplanus sp. XH21]
MSIPTDTGDELAAVADLFGAVTRAELERALAELAFKQGSETDDGAVSAAIDAAIENYYLVAVDGAEREEALLAAGPVAFPTLPDGAEDLPHILDIPDRDPDRTALVAAAERRLRADAARAVDAEDADRIAQLLDVSYDLETWGGTDVSDVRRRLDDARENHN